MFHRLLTLFACVLLAKAAAAEPLPTSIFRKLEARQKQTVVLYGTSLTAGGAWTGALKTWFEEQYPGRVTVINSGGSGQNSDWGKKNLQAKVLDHRPDLVLIEFSYNDAHEKFKMPVERGAENLAFIVGGIRQQNPEVAVILQIMNIPWDAPGDRRPATSRPQLKEFNDNYRTYAKTHGLPLLDHSIAFRHILETDPEKYHRWLPDGSHPNKVASLAVTWKGIREFLEKAQSAAKAE